MLVERDVSVPCDLIVTSHRSLVFLPNTYTRSLNTVAHHQLALLTVNLVVLSATLSFSSRVSSPRVSDSATLAVAVDSNRELALLLTALDSATAPLASENTSANVTKEAEDNTATALGKRGRVLPIVVVSTGAAANETSETSACNVTTTETKAAVDNGARATATTTGVAIPHVAGVDKDSAP